MTDHAEISRRLALAIGYLPEHVRTVGDQIIVNQPRIYGDCSLRPSDYWRFFDYRSPDVIWRIAATYKMFPFWVASFEKWFKYGRDGTTHVAGTPELAVALAVIGRGE